MTSHKSVKNLFAGYLKTPEAELLQGDFQLCQAPELLCLMENSADPGHFLELVMDHCNKLKRKDEGTFYTPSAVAEEMFRRSLEVFRKNNPSEESLFNIKVLDPACGSGEFILAALKVLLAEYRLLKPNLPVNVLIEQIICRNLYGIDCNSNAIELLCSRLKTAGGDNVSLENIVVKDVLEYSNAAECFNKNIKFDIVIGNPPYVSYGLRNVGKIDKNRLAELKKRFPFSAEYKITLYALFIEFALNSTAENGVQSFIVPDSFLCGQYFSKLRNFMLKTSSFEYFYLVKQKLFDAVPGTLVIYIASKNIPAAEHKFTSVLLDGKTQFSLPEYGYTMQQNTFEKNHRQRFRLFFNENIHKRVADIENNSVCKLGDLLDLASGLIARNGKSSIVADTPGKDGNYQRGLVSGKEITLSGSINYQGKFINSDSAKIKSGLKKIDYSQPKILIRQTGDRIVSAVDNNGFLVLNNIHVGTAKRANLDLERLAQYLNSDEMRFYYQAVTLEADRPMAQIDLETLRELPMKEFFEL